MEKYITINGVPVPFPKNTLTQRVATVVKSARNSNGVLVSQKIGRDQYKIESLEWSYLSASDWSKILKLCNNFYITVKFPDMVNNNWKTLKMYCGDRTAKIYKLGNDGLPIGYLDCKVNIIDVGEL